ncbi:hypothetical protein [Terriglobus aquaticus]|uniref:Uncharacterized protein n=1 Tax=Terriglobus aquaticus TaxID=940139 RepID=A0ABW9KGI7_9BACT|nr:hypothetical protein [Terriglobus aquaticus]
MFLPETPVRIETRLNRRQLIERLRREVAGSDALLLPQIGIVGRVGEHEAWFENRGFRFFSAGQVNRQLSLIYEEAPQGTNLVGAFAYPGTLRVIVPAALIVDLCLLAFWLFSSDRGSVGVPIAGCVITFVCLFLARLSAGLGRGREIELVEYLQEILTLSPPTVNGGTVIRPRHLQPDHSQTHPTD